MNDKSIPRFRLVPQRAFPSYAFIPGLFPHPTHNPLGHSYNRPVEEIEAPDPNCWNSNEYYLFGIDLFNHGYYWEAHEVWEDLWNADGRIGLPSAFLKGLIKLAAAGVKVREEIRQGAKAHALGAMRLFEWTRDKISQERYMGLSLQELIDFSHSIAEYSFVRSDNNQPQFIVFDYIMNPGF